MTPDAERNPSLDIPEELIHHIERKLPDLLPVRMLNEFAYLPRHFFYECVSSAATSDLPVSVGREYAFEFQDSRQ